LVSAVSVDVSEKVNFSSENYKLQSQLDEFCSKNYELQSQLDDVSKKLAVLVERVLKRDEKIQELESILERNKDEFNIAITNLKREIEEERRLWIMNLLNHSFDSI